ncbi:hypothetical protein MCOR25_009926 [Pyricularia grisea]|nr:hypothetical protein MCOR25_009926 [Pyricularia grisea]
MCPTKNLNHAALRLDKTESCSHPRNFQFQIEFGYPLYSWFTGVNHRTPTVKAARDARQDEMDTPQIMAQALAVVSIGLHIVIQVEAMRGEYLRLIAKQSDRGWVKPVNSLLRDAVLRCAPACLSPAGRGVTAKAYDIWDQDGCASLDLDLTDVIRNLMGPGTGRVAVLES